MKHDDAVIQINQTLNMNMRNLLRTIFAFAILILMVGIPLSTGATEASQPQYYELRIYTTQSERQQKLVIDYWQNAAGPAYSRLGIHPVGVFTELEDSSTNKIYVIIPYDSPGMFATVPALLAADSDYQKAAAGYMGVPKSDPAYVRFESSLLVAFEGMKKLALPPSTAEKKPWIFELRIYESPSESKGINKVQMFNSGEIPLMQEVGLNPVFFSQTVIGSHMPCLVYMVSGEIVIAENCSNRARLTSATRRSRTTVKNSHSDSFKSWQKAEP